MIYSHDLAVFGSGSWGTALAIACARNGRKVLLWGRDPDQIQDINQNRRNERYLPDVTLPASLEATTDFATCVRSARNLLIVVPSHAFNQTLTDIQPLLGPEQRIAWASKGLEPQTGRFLDAVIRERLGNSYPIAIFSGPTFARELAANLPTAITLASPCPDFASDLVELFHSERLRVYRSDDLIGVQLGGAVKNVIAVGAGMADGLGFGANARTALITRGLVELVRLGEAVGARKDTLYGMAGLGDLVLTCTDNQSRNRRFGLAIGRGIDIEEAERSIGQVVEGRRNTREVHGLAQRLGVNMPITEQIYRVLFEQMPPLVAARALLSRSPKRED